MYEEEEDLDYEVDEPHPLKSFLNDGTIIEVLGELKSGKEGTVYCCRPNQKFGVGLAAAKVFRSREHRTFRNQAIYRHGMVILNKRNARAVKKKTAWGRQVESGTWTHHEWEILQVMSSGGAPVPKPLALCDGVLLMEYIGDEVTAAPKLQEVGLEPGAARPLFDDLVKTIELFLRLNWIHGDLSPYNVLYWRDRLTVIDFPQAVDARTNPSALDLLVRDLHNICGYWRRYGVEADGERLARRMWAQYRTARL
jgi:RIO kinase 1